MAPSHQVLVLSRVYDMLVPQEVVKSEVGSCVREFVSQLMVRGGVFHFVSPAAHAIASRKLFIAQAAFDVLGRNDFLEVRQAVSEPVGEARERHEAVKEVEGALEHDLVAQRSDLERPLVIRLEESSLPEIALAQR